MAPKKPNGPKRKPREVEQEVTDRVLKFAVEYARTLKGAASAIAAGYSEKSAHVTASRLLKNPKVQAVIAETKRQHLQEAGVDAYKVLREFCRIAFGDIRQVVNWDDEGNAWFTPSKELSEDDAATVASITHTITQIPQKSGPPIEKHQVTLKRHDKMAALKALAQHLKLLEGEGGPSEVKANPLQALVDAVERSKKRAGG